MLNASKRLVVRSLNRIGYTVGRHREPWKAQERVLAGRAVRTIVDVGANVGDVTAEYRKRFPDARVLAVEPAPECLKALRARFASDAKVTIVPSGVADRDGERTLYLSGRKETHSLLERPKDGREYHHPDARVVGSAQVPVTTLDALCKAHDVEQVDLLKLDIEGAEMLALEGARGLLSENKIAAIFTEVMFIPVLEGQSLYYDLAAHLAAYGYSLHGLYDLHYTTSEQLLFGNALLVAPEIRRVIDSWP